MKHQLLILTSLIMMVTNSSNEEPKQDILTQQFSSTGSEPQSNSICLASDAYYDLWGYPVTWTDPQDGWDEEMRKSMVALTNYILDQSALLEAYTELGYKKLTIPGDLYTILMEARNNAAEVKWEKCIPSPYINCLALVNGVKVPKHNVQLMKVKNELSLRHHLVKFLKPIVEKWSGQKLSHRVVIYGIRRYLRGAWLSLHVDQVPTHILSVILQIDQKVDEEWPLTLIDHKGTKRKIFLQPGEMVLYEGAKIAHGRQFPFKGDYFENIFVHFSPDNFDLGNLS